MSKTTKYAGKWLKFCEISFADPVGKHRTWEMATRTGTTGAVGVIALLPGEAPQIVLVKQYRPPIECISLEFPAGLVDPGESAETAALRELEEETGYTGKVVDVGPAIYSSPGMTDESISMVTIEITGTCEKRPEEGEHIEIVVLPMHDLQKKLREIQSEGVALDAKLWSFAMGQSWQRTNASWI
ncbi:MAG: NUDIX hydrolase [Verrucomicrobiae bacterium]|nr:NUDIX hydrolase [Verrucomicrobiae bacterium]